MKFEKFNFRDKGELLSQASQFGLEIPFANDVRPLFSPLEIAARRLANRFVVLPMEGADADENGAPGTLTLRRYRRYAAGDSGLIWFEATAIVPEGRSNPRQLLLIRKNLDGFKRLVEETRQAGAGVSPLLILQLTHAGRYSLPKPIIARRHPLLDSLAAIPADHALISDDELDRLQERYLLAAGLAQESGFDGIDIKACHGYLINELLASFPRNESRYGGPLANRSRFLLQTIEKIGEEIPDLIVTSRLSMADFIAGGFGMDPDDPQKEDLTETRRVIAELKKIGVPLLNLSLGNPRVAPHLGRPFDVPLKGSAVPCENPLAGVARLIRLAGELQQAFHDLPLVSSGYSWLRQFFPNVAAGVLNQGGASLVGMGRNAFAYPDAPRDLLAKGRLDPAKVCITCSRCSWLLRHGAPAGCVVRDPDVY